MLAVLVVGLGLGGVGPWLVSCVPGSPAAKSAEQVAQALESVCSAELVVAAQVHAVKLPQELELLCADPALPERVVAALLVVPVGDAGR